MYSTKSFLTSFDVSYDKISKLIYNSEDIVTNLAMYCHSIEIQYGAQTVETDIERLEYYSPTTP